MSLTDRTHAVLQCPRCRAPLISRQSDFACSQCSKTFADSGGIIDLRLGDRREHTDDTDLKELTERLSGDNWAASIRQLAGARRNVVATLFDLTAHGKFAWKVFLNLASDAILLDAACGYGSATQNLAPHVGTVFALEADHQKLTFAQKRFSIFNQADDITLINFDQPGVLPFTDGTFDIVVVPDLTGLAYADDMHDGVDGSLQATPRTIQENILKEANRVLKPSGQLLFVARNLFDYDFLSGLSDNAAPWLRNSPLLRSASTPHYFWRCWRRQQMQGYSAASYRRQSKSARFHRVTMFGLTGHRAVNEIIPLRARAALKRGNRGPLKRRLKRHRFLVPKFGVIATKSSPAELSTHNRILEKIAQDVAGTGAAKSLKTHRYLVTRKDKLVILATLENRGVVVRIPFSDAAKAAEARHSATISWFKSAQPNGDMAPEQLAEGRVDGIEYRVEAMVPGQPLRARIRQHGHVALSEEVATLLEQLNPPDAINLRPFEGAIFKRLVTARLDRLSAIVTNPSEQNRLRDFFDKRLHGAQMAVGLVHGDFSISNIYAANRRTTGIIDWESASRDDLPILDVIGYLESIHRTYNKSHRIHDSIAAVAAQRFREKEDRSFLFSQYERLGIEPKYHQGLAYLRWLRLVDYLLPYWLKYSPTGQRVYIHQVIEAFPCLE